MILLSHFSYRVYNSTKHLQKLNLKKMSFSVYVTRPDVPEIAFEMFKKKGYEVSKWTERRPVPRNVLLQEIAGKDALFCMLTDKIDAEVIEKAGPDLKVVATMSVGYEHMDVMELTKKNIAIGYTPGVLTDAVAELTVSILLATTRRLFEAHQAIRDGEWSAWAPDWMCGLGLRNSTVGIVGYGRIGKAVGKILESFCVKKILFYSRTQKPGASSIAKQVSLDTLLESSDFVIVTCALTEETRGMFNEKLFKKMKPTSIFINTSRGDVVVQNDLIEALKTGKIKAAGLDVMTPEPLPQSHPLLELKNCVVIPHIGSATSEARRDMAELTANNIIAALEKKPMPAGLVL